MLVNGNWKILVWDEIEGVWFLSNTQNDKSEKDNLAGDNEDTVRGLLKNIRELKRHDEALREKYWSGDVERTANLSDEETAKLEALGYLE